MWNRPTCPSSNMSNHGPKIALWDHDGNYDISDSFLVASFLLCQSCCASMATPTAPSYQPWGTLPVSQTCFQIYGTKRKACKATHNDCSNTNEQISASVKRHCLHPVTRNRLPEEKSEPFPQPVTYPASSSLWQQDMASSPRHSMQEHFQTAFRQPTSMQATDIVQSECTSPQSQGFYSNGVHSVQSPADTTTSGSGLNIGNDQSGGSKSHSWQHKENNQRLFEQRNQNRIEMLEDLEFESNDYWDVPYDHHLLKMADEVEQARIAMETEDSLPQHQPSGLPTSDSTLIPASVPLQIHNAGNHIRCYCKPSWEGLLEPVSYI
ncbi:uncharacterized protein LOC119725745 isoform X4 [Patiria miniata]|uniref:Uncharacterized protein n=1 Tax=Patiria miniata TaxID=46514 RepID=A0A913ZPD1_PATMI|nr:uncharacterized protein LOC119725745 isoform X4 [Patiria miniata]